MNAQEQSRAGKQGQGIRQATIILPYFEEEVPALYLADGTPYLPVRPLCHMLGLSAQTHIPRWRRLVLWTNARKLPLQTRCGQRLVWCLPIGALPFWCACFNWSLVEPARREQLHQATDAWLEGVAQAHQLMLARYRSLRTYLFAFLEAYSDAEAWLDQWERHLPSCLGGTSSRQFECLLSQGKTLIGQAAMQARKMVQEQAMAPIMDIVTIDASGEVAEIGTFSLFPVVPREELFTVFAYTRELVQWYQEVAAFITSLKRSQNGDRSEEA
jgi:hypothetical protein